MSESGFRSLASSYGVPDGAAGSPTSANPSVDEIIIGQDVPLFYSVDYETQLLSDAGILESVEEAYHFDAASLSGDLPEDWALPGDDFSLDSALHGPAALSPEPVATQTSSQTQTIRSPSHLAYPSTVMMEKPLVAQHRQLANRRAEEDLHSSGPIRRRGRPVKVGSTSKSALYAREYRTKGKELLESYRIQVEELMARNRTLEANQARLSDKYFRLQEELEEVQEANQKLQSEIVPAISKILGAERLSLDDVCVHLSAREGVSIKNCRHCKTSQSAHCVPSKNLPLEEYLC
ncbi:hypothetical protein QR680_008808 [Steinernema hermaphroditum]|uniref:BZIP domain-containing protein n=1 Tax=Steinernema hermaphroditum TaxID=289476 RepID=A0AA39II19_9BILA|nr:hypothetical protein QR680_008808 [Steinernema hermaphroditum]